MGVIGIAIWIFAGTGAALGRAVLVSALVTAAYVLAFWSGNFLARAVFGVLELAVILYWWWFSVARAMDQGFGRLATPQLAVVFGLTTLVIGSILGVLVQVLLASGQTLSPTPDYIGAHASAQVGGYLVLVSAGFIEWQFSSGGKRTAAGLVQVALLFLGGLVLSLSLLIGNQALPAIATLLTLAGIVVVVVRLGRAALSARWLAPTGDRHIAIAVPFLVAGVVLQAILVQQFIAAQGDFTRVSIGLVRAYDHVMFVGLMTNVLFGAILMSSAGGPRLWPWADDVVFWGLNIGVAAFAVVLLVAGSGAGKAPFTHPVAFVAPVMGLSVLLGIVTFTMRLASPRASIRAGAPA
jgi:hypothetical protein